MHVHGSASIWIQLFLILCSVGYALPCWSGWWPWNWFWSQPAPEDPEAPEDGFLKKNPHIPKHAVMPRQRGKPDYCFDGYQYGNCNSPQKRWYFDANDYVCKQFTYSGCGGNYNQFRFKRWCQVACGDPPRAECNKYGTCEYN